MKSSKLVTALIFAGLTLSNLYVLAQAPPPGPGAGGPVDGGAALLVAGVAAYGYKKIKDRHQDKNL